MTSRRKQRHREDAMFDRLPTLGAYDLAALRALTMRERDRSAGRRLAFLPGPDWQARYEAVEAEQQRRAQEQTTTT